MDDKKEVTQANQYQPDPRQALFLKYYIDPKSDTFSNALQSGLKAGYSQEYAESITAQMPDWLSEVLGDNRLLRKAEKNLEEMLDLPVEVVTYSNEDGSQVITKTEPSLVKIKQDTAKFIAERLGKEKYSTRVENTGQGGGAIQHQITGINYVTPNDPYTGTNAETDVEATPSIPSPGDTGS